MHDLYYSMGHSQKVRGGPIKQRINYSIIVYGFERPEIQGVDVTDCVARRWVNPALPYGWAVVVPRAKREREKVVRFLEMAGYKRHDGVLPPPMRRAS